MRLYFFPALLPLAPLLPWLLTALGALAAVIRKLRHRRSWAWVALLLFIAAAGTALWQRSRLPSAAEGTRMTPTAALPKTEHFRPDEPQKSVKAPEGLLTEAWYHMNNRRALSGSLALPDWIIVGTYEGDVQAISIRTGEPVWSLRKSEPVLSPAAIYKNTAFIGEGLHTALRSALTAIDLATGDARWQREFLGHIESAPAIDEARGRLYSVSGPSGLWSLDPKDGAVLWHAKLGHVDSTPLIQGSSLWATAQPDEKKAESVLHELDPDTGKSRFELKVPGQPWGEPQAVGDLILFTTGIGQVGPATPTDRGWSHALSIKTHQLAWSVSLETMPLPQSTLSIPLGLVFHTLKSGKVVALNLRDGHTEWSFDLGAPCLAGPALVGGGVIAALPTDGHLVLLNAKTGKLLQRTEAGSNATTAPLVNGSQLYIIAGDSLTAFELSRP